MENGQEITLFLRDYKALLKFRNFVRRYFPNYHICPKCGELIPENGSCLHCYVNNDLELCKNIGHLNEQIGLNVEPPNSTKQLIKQLEALNKWNGQK